MYWKPKIYFGYLQPKMQIDGLKLIIIIIVIAYWSLSCLCVCVQFVKYHNDASWDTSLTQKVIYFSVFCMLSWCDSIQLQYLRLHQKPLVQQHGKQRKSTGNKKKWYQRKKDAEKKYQVFMRIGGLKKKRPVTFFSRKYCPIGSSRRHLVNDQHGTWSTLNN